jgi:hypothetical protein
MANFDDLLNNSPAGEAPPQLSKEEYAAKKQAEREDVFVLADETALAVADDGAKFKSFLDLQARLDRYSAVNALLTFAQNPAASRLGDFDHWKRQNCSIRSGQTAISILEPHEYTKEDGSPGTGYNVKKVFDISQVDTRKFRSAPAPHFSDRQLLGALVSKAPVTITGVDELPDGLVAMYDPQAGSISVRRGMEFFDTFRGVAQELALADLTTGAEKQAAPEFSAYCASYLLCKKYGVDTQPFSFDSAPGVFDGMDEQEIKGELSQIRNVAEDISGRMARQLEAQQRAARNQDAR